MDIHAIDVERSPSADSIRIRVRFKRASHVAGTLLFVLSLIFVGSFAMRNRGAFDALADIGARPILTAAFFCCLTHLSSSAAWIFGLRQMGQVIPFGAGVAISLAAQIGKYLPGNVAHYFARAGLAATRGVGFTSSGVMTLLEICATLLAGAVVVSVSMVLDEAPAAAINRVLLGSYALSALTVAIAGLAMALFLRVTKVPLCATMSASVCMIGSFILIGLSFHTIVAATSAVPLSPVAAIGIYAVAWTAGYIVPGVPAGLGVREAVLVAWIGPILGAGPALACVMLHRVVTAGVDGVVALIGYGCLRARMGER